MTLELLIQILSDFGLKRNLVNWVSAGPSIYSLNPVEIKKYPLLFISPTERIEVGKNTTEYGLTIYFCDRLLDGNINETQIYSTGAETLTNFLRQIVNIEGIVEVTNPSIRMFTSSEKMQDRLAGAYTTVTITVLNTSNCPTYFDSEGRAIGSYLPAGYGNITTLVTDTEFKQTLQRYTPTKSFATINGSAITEGGEIIIEGGGGGNYDREIQELSATTSSLTEELSSLSAFTESGYTGLQQEIESLSGGTLDAISGLNGSITELNDTFNDRAVSAMTDSYFLFWLPNNSYSSTTTQRYETLYDYLERGLWQLVVFYKGTHKDRFGKIFTYQVDKDENSNNYYTVTTYVPNTTLGHIYKVIFEIGKNLDGSFRYTVLLQESVVGAFFVYDTELSGILSGYTSTAATEELSAVTSGISSDLKALSAYTESIVIPDLSDYATTAVTEELSAVTSSITEEVQTLTASAVTSTSIRTIWSGSQADYDLIDPKDNNTFYIIV